MIKTPGCVDCLTADPFWIALTADPFITSFNLKIEIHPTTIVIILRNTVLPRVESYAIALGIIPHLLLRTELSAAEFGRNRKGPDINQHYQYQQVFPLFETSRVVVSGW